MEFDLRATLISLIKACENISHLSAPNCRKLDNQVLKFLSDYKRKIVDRIEETEGLTAMICEDIKLMTDEIMRELTAGKLSLTTQTITLKWEYKTKSARTPRIMISSFYRYIEQIVQLNPIANLDNSKYGDELLLYVYRLAHIVSTPNTKKMLEPHIERIETSIGWRSNNKSGLSGMFEQLGNGNLKDIMTKLKGEGLTGLINNLSNQYPEFMETVTSTAKSMYQDERMRGLFTGLLNEHQNLDKSLNEATKDEPVSKPEDDEN